MGDPCLPAGWHNTFENNSIMMKQTDDEIIDLAKDLKWIGILDYDIKTFDIVMTTEYGTTYNSYFINSQKKTLVEVAKARFSETYINKIKSVTDPSEIEYIILDHTEPDHSGSLGLILDLAPSATVVGSGNAIRYLEDIINKPFRSLVVRDGDSLDLGNKTLRFISAPNLHWPDSIYSYLEEDKILFTCDSFGAHYCDKGMISTLENDDYRKAFKYYFDVILKPFSRFMVKAITKIRHLEIEMICPGHGPVHKENLQEVVDLTEEYSNNYLKQIGERQVKKVLVTYVSAYGFTGEAAQYISEGIKEAADFNVEITDIENISPGELGSKLASADALLVGSPTINQNTLLPVYTLFALINPLRDKDKTAGAFGSYGWSGEATKIILENMRNLKLKVFEESAAFKFSPGGTKKENLIEYGRKFAHEVLRNCNDKKNPGN
jgi:flavorubredoxin